MTGRIIHGDATEEAWESVTPSGMTPGGVSRYQPPLPPPPEIREPKPAFNVFGYRHHDRTSDSRKEQLPAWNLHRLEAWILANRFDVVLIEKSDDPARGRPDVIHHVCADPVCPGGC